MPASKEPEQHTSDRLLLIEGFTKDGVTTEFQRGYLTCLMEEAALDMEDAASDTFQKALELFQEPHRGTLERTRLLTLR